MLTERKGLKRAHLLSNMLGRPLWVRAERKEFICGIFGAVLNNYPYVYYGHIRDWNTSLDAACNGMVDTYFKCCSDVPKMLLKKFGVDKPIMCSEINEKGYSKSFEQGLNKWLSGHGTMDGVYEGINGDLIDFCKENDLLLRVYCGYKSYTCSIVDCEFLEKKLYHNDAFYCSNSIEYASYRLFKAVESRGIDPYYKNKFDIELLDLRDFN